MMNSKEEKKRINIITYNCVSWLLKDLQYFSVMSDAHL